MLDLDYLKHTNDTFGHEWGDRYIGETGRCFAQNAPAKAVCARISGDEFNLLFYGYDSEEEIREEIRRIKAALDEIVMPLPSGRELRISISGGIAWYPRHGTSIGELKNYADFAMYQIKQNGKGRIGEFDPECYRRESVNIQCRREFNQLIDQELLRYHFQPIVDAGSGQTVAFEALMRVNLPTLNTPALVIRFAREMNCVHEIERLTMFKGAESYENLKSRGFIRGDELLFLNSIACQHMTAEEEDEYVRRFGDLRNQMVIEVTEDEATDPASLEWKRCMLGDMASLAMDHYDGGLEKEESLLKVAPDYVKVDWSVIHEIDRDPDKQEIMRRAVAYAHKKNRKVVAEGVENREELLMVLSLEADLLQGFYLAKPAAVPEEIDPEALAVIKAYGRIC